MHFYSRLWWSLCSAVSPWLNSSENLIATISGCWIISNMEESYLPGNSLQARSKVRNWLNSIGRDNGNRVRWRHKESGTEKGDRLLLIFEQMLCIRFSDRSIDHTFYPESCFGPHLHQQPHQIQEVRRLKMTFQDPSVQPTLLHRWG